MAYNAATSSGLLAASAVISNLPGQLAEIVVGPGATVTLYDNATAGSGFVLAQVVNASTSSLPFEPRYAVVFNNGLYADISGGNAVIYYIPG